MSRVSEKPNMDREGKEARGRRAVYRQSNKGIVNRLET